MTRKELFLKFLDEVAQEGYEYFSVTIKTEGSDGNEVIINPMCNYEKKKAYYDKAYDDGLVLKSFNGIKIVGYDAFDNNCILDNTMFSEEYYESSMERGEN